MPGYNRPDSDWRYAFDGLNTIDAPDQLNPTEYPYARNIRALDDFHVRTRPGYSQISGPFGTATFQIEFTGSGIANDSISTPTLFYRSSKLIHPSRYPRATFQLETKYYNPDAASVTITLYGPSGLIRTLTLPSTGTPSDPNHYTLIRDSTVLTLTEDGTYRLELSASGGGTFFCLATRLVGTQPNPYLTVEHKRMLVAPNASVRDLSGIAGADIYRTTSLTYAPTMVSGSGYPPGIFDEDSPQKNNFVWFNYIASEWPDLSYCQLEAACDGFADHSFAALYKVSPTSTIQTFVTGSEAVHANADPPLTPAISGHFTLPSDGFYAIRFKAQWSGSAANAFFYTGWLHLVSVASSTRARGLRYFFVGNSDDGQIMSNPGLDAAGSAYYEMCGIHHPSLGTQFLHDSGTSNTGIGAVVSGSGINMNGSYTKTTDRSGVIAPSNLPANHRFTGDDDGGNAVESNIVDAYSIEVFTP